MSSGNTSPVGLTPDPNHGLYTLDDYALRAFVLDESTDTPISGVAFSLTPYAAGVITNVQLGILKTDSYGYISFKFQIPSQRQYEGVVIAPLGKQGMGIQIPFQDIIRNDGAFTVKFPQQALTTLPSQANLPSVMQPDPIDYVVSPGSVAAIPNVNLTKGVCGSLVPNSVTVYRNPFRQIVRDPDTLQVLQGLRDQATIMRGTLFEYEVTWNPRGHSLGEILNSFSLAPCESIKVSTLDQYRSDSASRAESDQYQQENYSNYNRDRLTEEAVKLTSKSFHADYSTNTKLNIDLSSIAHLPLTASMGTSSNAAYDWKKIASDSVSKLSDRISYYSSAVAVRNNMVVMESSSVTSNIATTRAVNNNNHCHTLNLMYYQVMRNYLVKTDFLGRRELVLVQYPVEEFTPERVFCKAHILKNYMLDPRLAGCFEGLEKHLYCCTEEDVQSGGTAGNGSSGKQVLISTLTVTLRVGSNKPGNNRDILFSVEMANGARYDWTLAPRPNWQLHTTYTFTISVGTSLNAVDVRKVGLEYIDPPGPNANAQVDIDSLDVKYTALNYPGTYQMYQNTSLNTMLQQGDRQYWNAQPEIPQSQIDPSGDENSAASACQGHDCCAKILVNHIQCNKVYYNTLLWFFEDSNERAIRLAKIPYPTVSNPAGSLLDAIENNPVGILGDFVAFPASDSVLEDDPSILPKYSVVVMPTRGVFMEGLLGNCSTCETVDDTKFWDWSKAPCPCDAPAPSPLTSLLPLLESGQLDPTALANLLSAIPSVPDSASLLAAVIKFLLESKPATPASTASASPPWSTSYSASGSSR